MRPCGLAVGLSVTLAVDWSAGAEPPQWKFVPLRTAEQKAAWRWGGEMGQMAFTLAICRQNPELLALGIDTAAVYVSEDGGGWWDLRRAGIHSNGVQSIAFDPVNDQVLWAAGTRSAAGTKRGYPPDPKYYDDKADGIYRSDDRGQTWTLLRNAAFLRAQAQNEYFAFDPADATTEGCRTIYVATHDAGLLKTTDGGETWTEVGPTRAIFNAVVRDAAKRCLWLAADEGLWFSPDDATTWTAVETPGTPVRGLAVDPQNPQRVYIALSQAGLWRSADGGETWERCGGLPNKRWIRLAISPADPQTLYVEATRWGGPAPYHSHDGGRTWAPMEAREPGFYGLGVYWGEGLVAHPTEPRVAYHLYPPRRTTDGGKTWQLYSDGVSGSRRQGRSSIAFRPDDPRKMMFFHTDHGATLTTDGGDTWTYVTAPRQADIGAMTMPGGAYDPRPGSRRVISAVGGWSQQRLCISEDDGASWTVLADRLDNYRFFAWHPHDPQVVYVGTATAGLRSDDGGQTWGPLDRPVRVMGPDGDTLYAVTVVRRGVSRVEWSLDRGATWSPLGDDIPYQVADIDVDPRHPGRVYAATSYGGIWIHDGQSWSARGEADGLEKDYFGAMLFQHVTVDPTNPEIVYAGQNHCWRGAARGIFRSTDAGRTWRNINGNLGPDLTVWSIVVSPHDGTVWLGTDYGNLSLPPPGAEEAGGNGQ